MGKFLTFISIILIIKINSSMAAEAGMPQLNTEFWLAQIFWLIFIFGTLYLVIWKLILPRINDSIENRKKSVINDLGEAQKLKESAEKRLKEYNKIIEDSKNQAKKIIMSGKIKLENDIGKKRKKFEEEIEEEIINVEQQIKKFQRSSVDNINKIAAEISNEVIKNTLGSQGNMSNITAVVEEISKTKLKKYL